MDEKDFVDGISKRLGFVEHTPLREWYRVSQDTIRSVVKTYFINKYVLIVCIIIPNII